MIEQISINIFLLYVWFQTDAFAYYFKRSDYFEYIMEFGKISYPDFLFVNNPGFLTKLLSCTPCLLFWINMISSFLFGFNLFFFKWIISLLIYKMICKIVS